MTSTLPTQVAAASSLEELFAALQNLAAGTPESAWPVASMQLVATAGVPGWCIPAEYGGAGYSATALIHGYRRLAQACLTTAFILTQRNGAAQRIADSSNQLMKQTWLPGLATGEKLATVGISHLTTSRQHWTSPTVAVEETPNEFILRGEIPWVTAAHQADLLVTGGVLPSGRQVLLACDTRSPGFEPQPSMKLLALEGSQTAAVRLNDVVVAKECLLAGPSERVLKPGIVAAAGAVSTSALAAGLCRRVINELQQMLVQRADLTESVKVLGNDVTHLETLIRQLLAGTGGGDVTTETVRTTANLLALRCTQFLLAASKGAGYISGHIAERFARESLFFLVWSCPQPVLTATMASIVIPGSHTAPADKSAMLGPTVPCTMPD